MTLIIWLQQTYDDDSILTKLDNEWKLLTNNTDI